MTMTLRLDWRFSHIKWLTLLLLSVTRLSRHPPFLGGSCCADGNGGDEKERGQNVSLVMNDEGSGERGGGRRHAARASEASKTVTFATDYVPVAVPVNAVIVFFVDPDPVTAFVAYLVLFVRCWTSCRTILFCGSAARATGFRFRRRLLLCLLSHDSFRPLFLGLLGSPFPSSPSPFGTSMFLPAPFQPFRRGRRASSAEPGSGSGRRGRGNGGGGRVVGIVGRM